MQLKQLDSLVIDVLMDNQSDNYSSKWTQVSPEFKNIIDAGAEHISGATLCCAQLGLSLLLTATVDGRQRKLLFDAGPEGAMLVRNCKNLGVTLTDVEAIAISHGHWDHMGALIAMLNEISHGRRVPVYVNPGMFLERGALLADGKVAPFERVPSTLEISRHGGEVVSDASERYLLDDAFYYSGEIPRVTPFERGRTDHMCRENRETPWRSDPLLMDERYLVAHVRGKGLVIFSSCSHAGIINVLSNVRTVFGTTPIFCVFGGLHLVGSLEAIIPDTVQAMKEFSPTHVVPAHCSGFRATNALINAFGEQVVQPSAVGNRYTFSATK